jgi:hypothetical protein
MLSPKFLRVCYSTANSAIDLNFLGGVKFLLEIGQLHQDTLSVPQHHVHHDLVTGIELAFDIVVGLRDRDAVAVELKSGRLNVCCRRRKTYESQAS